MDRALLVLCALLLNAAIAGPREWYVKLGISRLAALPGRLARHAERKLNREHRSAEDRRLRGWAVVAAALFTAGLLGAPAAFLFANDLRFIELVLVALLLPVRPIWDRASAIRRGLAATDIPKARGALVGTPWKHHALLDEHGLARAAIETTAVDFSEKLVAPVLAYLWLGLPGLFIVKALSVLQSALAQAPEFGEAAAVTHRWLHFIPARLAAAFLLFSALFLTSANIAAAAKQVGAFLLTDTPRALMVRTQAAVLNLALGGPKSPYLGVWAESGAMKTLPSDISRALVAYLFACIGLFIFAGAFF